MAIRSAPSRSRRIQLRYARSNAAVGAATRDLVLGWHLPSRLQPLGARALYAVMDDPLLDAFGFPRATPAERRAVRAALRARSRVQARLPARRRPVLETRRRQRSYPDGYHLDDLGPGDGPAGA